MKLQNCKTCSEKMTSRFCYDVLMDIIALNSTVDEYFLGMTYKYHADAMLYLEIDYKKICTPLLVVAGAKDTIIHSSDAFVEKAESMCVNITYLRVEDMDHYIRKRPDIINRSFEWLKKQLYWNDQINNLEMHVTMRVKKRFLANFLHSSYNRRLNSTR